tara:strand:- start:870 stop:1343 length:474 start_codon:yes stop_codon:yes gene_type:complete
MKTLVIILSTIGLLSLNSCKQEADLQALMQNPENRTEVYDAITKNHDYMTEFMEEMHNSDHAMQMIQGEGMQMMMKDSTMMNNMMGNKPMMHSMMNQMMNDGKMMGTMMKMMHEKGMMSEDCMESCSKMMGEKGMDMQGMKMDNMDSSTKDDHTEHH